MAKLDYPFFEYYTTKRYRGFSLYKLNKCLTSGATTAIFGNGTLMLKASGNIEKDALKKIFDEIDQYFKQRSEYLQSNQRCHFSS